MAERLKGIAKGGWHPKGSSDGARESRLGNIKGGSTVAGWMGRGKSSSEAAQEHQSTPLSSLRDPDSFGPPPKHIDYYGPSAAQQSSSRGGSFAPPASPAPSSADSARARLQAKKEAQARAEEEANRPPPGPYRVDTTGLRTDHLPPPPPFRPEQSTPPPAGTFTKRRLPPRLPPRQNSHPDAHAPAPPPPYSALPADAAPADSLLNQGALNRLGKAGVSVPGLEIGARTSSPPVPPRRTASPAAVSPLVPGPRSPQVDELQSRFARMSATTDRRSGPAPPPQSPVLPAQAAAKKKPPPPPPPKKKDLTTNAAQPPPIPFDSKPRF